MKKKYAHLLWVHIVNFHTMKLLEDYLYDYLLLNYKIPNFITILVQVYYRSENSFIPSLRNPQSVQFNMFVFFQLTLHTMEYVTYFNVYVFWIMIMFEEKHVQALVSHNH